MQVLKIFPMDIIQKTFQYELWIYSGQIDILIREGKLQIRQIDYTAWIFIFFDFYEYLRIFIG